ncbi:hypothetical protein GHK92_07235 [Nocardioides sp. dk4132]|uniref:Rv3235 family protein n=1 Tax=unclassified Nocardioides TaxID=2615069 RepID=UPI001297FB81|nr:MULTISPECIES: Rv3235 family protein [unclassified Nocardioides]MQW75660.1 hypothetical protein [Nocardioides sp. dk4132]QGA08554.1 hypothetical protein GFH29_14985 [Nocardioides sp. dk884]
MSYPSSHPSLSQPPQAAVRALGTPRAVPVASVQGTLALDLLPASDPPAPTPLARYEAAPGAGGPGGEVVPIDLHWRREVEQWSHRFAQAAVEIVGGDRPATQLLRWTTRSVYADLERRALLVARAGGHEPGTARVQPVRPRVLSVRACFVERTVVETGIHVRYGERSRAVAARFELRRPRHETRARWLCTALDFS